MQNEEIKFICPALQESEFPADLQHPFENLVVYLSDERKWMYVVPRPSEDEEKHDYQ